MKTIILTGASGYVGGYLYNELGHIYNVIPCCRENGIDLTKEGVVDTILERVNGHVFAIINLACITAKPENLTDISVLTENIKIAYNISQIAKIIGVHKLLNFSSISVYPCSNGEFDETSPIDPSINADALYGISKYNTEAILNYYLKKSLCKILHLRVSNIYSYNYLPQKGIIKEFMDGLTTENRICIWGGGQKSINLMSLETLLNKIVYFIENDRVGVLNLNERTISYLELANEIITEFGNKQSKVEMKNKMEDILFKIKSVYE